MLWFALGIVGFVLGIFLLVGASIFALLFGPGGPGCAMDPLCLVSPVLHWTVVAIGILLLLLGVAGIVFSVRRSMMRGPSLTLPP